MTSRRPALGRRSRPARPGRWARLSLLTGTVAAGVLTVHTAVNARLLRVAPGAQPVTELVSVLLPARDEAGQVTACLSAVLASVALPHLEVIVYDDASTDSTAEAVGRAAEGDPRVRIIHGGTLPAGWLGKPHACARLADEARGSVLVFIDADVTVAPDGIARTVGLLRASGLGLVSPYPRQEARTVAERLVQPLLQWSWLALLPLRLAEQSSRPSLSAANGQLLCVDTTIYHQAGGHTSVRGHVLEDIALLRALKAAGARGVVTDGTDIARTRMYHGWPQLRDGYAKSLWAGGGSIRASAGQVGILAWLFVLPAVAMLRGSRTGLAGYALGVAGRVIAARRTGGRSWPDALAHPLSICVFGYLTALSWAQRLRGTATWKGRPV